MRDGIRDLTERDSDDCHSLLAVYRYPALADLRVVRRDIIERLCADSVWNATQESASVALGRWSKDRLKGFIVFRKIEFDTRLFGFPCYALAHFQVSDDSDFVTRDRLLKAALDRLARKGTRLVSARTNALETSAMLAVQRSRFVYMDTTMRYAFDLGPSPPPIQSTVLLREARDEDQDSLTEIAATYTENRFHYDPKIPRDKADEMYRLWIRNSLRGDADWIVVAELDGKPVGFTTNKNHPELITDRGGWVGEMVFSAVSPQARGRDVYTSMIHAGLLHFHGAADLVYLGCLASNVAVQRAWQRLGFRVTSAACSFHRWLA